ncbi:MAG: hypothetical protein MJZ93_00670 [Paludibacteraceae bacterium]|nr:hypothetical protein [Paludibacteraceae bacterium]
MKKSATILPLCIIGAAIAAFVIAISIITNLVFTPKRLTEIADKAAGSVFIAPHRFDNVELTFWRTFPKFGFKVNNLSIGSSTSDNPSDTLAYIPELIVTLNFQKYFIDDVVEINNIAFKNGHINLHINENGECNWHILKENATDKMKNLPFKMELQHIDIAHLKTSFIDEKDSIKIKYARVDIDAIARTDRDYKSLTFDDCHFVMEYDSIVAEIRANASFSDTIGFHFDQFDLGIYDLDFSIKGEYYFDTNLDNVYSDLTLNANDLKISKLSKTLTKPIWKYAPKAEKAFRSIQDSIPNELKGDAFIDLYVHSYGFLDSTNRPLIDISMNITDLHGHYDYSEIPYRVNNAYANISSHLDLNNLANSSINIRNITAYVSPVHANLSRSNNRIVLKGKMTDLFPTDDIAVFNPETDINCKMEIIVDKHTDSTEITGLFNGNITYRNRWDNFPYNSMNGLQLQAHFDGSNLQMITSDGSLSMPHCNIKMTNDSTRFTINSLAFNTDTDCLNITNIAGKIAYHGKSSLEQYLTEWSADNLLWYTIADNDTTYIDNIQCVISDRQKKDVSTLEIEINNPGMETIIQKISTIYRNVLIFIRNGRIDTSIF